MSDRFSNITLHDSILMKGWAILLIVLHNYFHLIYKVTKENEMDFDGSRFISLTTESLVNPTEWAHGIFTFFGHFGVQLFIFLSAYGMAKAYSDVSADKMKFFLGRLRKIYPTFLIAVGLWLLVTTVWDVIFLRMSLMAEVKALSERLFDVTKVAFGVHNFFPGHGYPKVGPWWFIPFIIQFYLLWALLGSKLIKLSKGAMLSVTVGGIVFNYLVVPLIGASFHINLLYSPLGHIPEIMLAVYWARYGFALGGRLVIGALVVFVLSSLYQYAWPLHHISALVLLLWLAFFLLSYGSKFLSGPLHILGIYSMPLFLVNGFLRPPFTALSRNFDVWYVDIMAALALVFFSLGVAILVSKTEKNLTERIGGQ